MTDLQLQPVEREVAAAEVRSVLGVTTDPERGAALGALLADVEAGVVTADAAERLEQIVDLGLHTGRIRALHGPGGEAAALRLHRRLPGGAEAAASAAAVSAALSSLAGRPLDSVDVVASGPGRFTLTLAAGGRTLSVRLDRSGARLASVEA